MNSCTYCDNNDFIRTKVQYVYRRNGKFLVVNNVPCEECSGCGERYYDASVLRQIEAEFDAITRGEKDPRHELIVPVEEYSEFAVKMS